MPGCHLCSAHGLHVKVLALGPSALPEASAWSVPGSVSPPSWFELGCVPPSSSFTVYTNDNTYKRNKKKHLQGTIWDTYTQANLHTIPSSKNKKTCTANGKRCFDI